MTCTTNSITTLVRGDTRKINITITDEFGNPIDLKNDKLFFTLKTDLALADSLATLQVVQVLPADALTATGIATLVLSATDMATVPPGKYYYDIQWVTSIVPEEVTTIDYGVVNVVADATISTT